MARDDRTDLVDSFETLRVAQRAFTLRRGASPAAASETETPEAEDSPPTPATMLRRPGREVLVFDTETRTTPEQAFMVLVWRLYVDHPDTPAATTLVEEGIAYPDALPVDSPDEYAALTTYASEATSAAAPAYRRMGELGGGVLLEPLSWWLTRRFWHYGYRHRDRCDVVGFNLPFDLGALAAYWAPAKRDWRGGWSLAYWGSYDKTGTWKDADYRPRLLVRSLDPRRARISWGSVKDTEDRRGPGRFVDLRTLAFALTGNGMSLEAASAAFGHELSKAKVEHGRITPRLLDYARRDVEATSYLYAACQAELELHTGVTLAAPRLYSPATIGTQYLRAMGVAEPFTAFTPFTPAQLGKRARPPRKKRST